MALNARLIAALIVVSSLTCSRAAVTPTQTYMSSTSLVANDVYELFWSYDSTSITFEVHAMVKGWVGFGLSPNGGMASSDIVTGWVKDGVPYFQDRYATGEFMPTQDSSQDWQLLSASETSTHTVLKFRRPLIICNSEDRNITGDTMRVIFAYSSTDPSSVNGISYHGANRGTKSMLLIATHASAPSLPSDAFYVDFLNKNYTIDSSKDTTYWCTGFNAPTLSGKHHVIKVEPVVQSGNEAYVHHVLLYACYHTPSNIDTASTSFECYVNNMPWDSCDAPFVAWSVGGLPFSYPEHVGFPMGDGGVLYIRMETHYDNPNLTPNVMDASGLRVWFTPTLRQYDAGLLEAGAIVLNQGQILPGGYSDLISHGHCSKTCLDAALGTQNDIKVFGTMLHSHLLGTAVRVRHYTSGVEKAYLDEDSAYDFNYQDTRIINPEITVSKGDNLVVECNYNTLGKNTTTVGGQGTNNEMCLAYIWYYPKINLTKCQSVPTQVSMAKALQYSYSIYSAPTGYVTITNGTGAGSTMYDYLLAVGNWTDEQAKAQYQTGILTGDIFEQCKDGTTTYSPHFTITAVPSITSTYTPAELPCGGSPSLSTMRGLLLVAVCAVVAVFFRL